MPDPSSRSCDGLPRHHDAAKAAYLTGMAPSEPPVPKKPLTPAAARALAEAEARRAEADRKAAGQAKEVPDRGGLDPTRYGDWEHKGLASDF
jgi:hypothetical protein